MIILIAAVAKNWAIGKNNKMLWHLPNDFKHFKTKTLGKTIVMGRKTFESLPGVLPNRKHIIITRNSNYMAPANCSTAPNLISVLNEYTNETLYIIGGGEIYKQAIFLADKIELTIVNEEFDEADTYFPKINLNDWEITYSEKHLKDDKHAYDYEFITFIKK